MGMGMKGSKASVCFVLLRCAEIYTEIYFTFKIYQFLMVNKEVRITNLKVFRIFGVVPL